MPLFDLINELKMMKVLVTTTDFAEKANNEIDSNSILTWFVATQLSLSFGVSKRWELSIKLEDMDGIPILNTNDDFQCVYVDNIVRIENISNQSCIYLENESFLKTQIPIDNFSDILIPYNFFKIHPNHLINVKHLKSLTYCNAFVTLSNSVAIPISNGNDKELGEYLNNKPLI